MNPERILKGKITRIFKKNWKSKAEFIANVGGARSSKSHSCLQKLIVLMHTQENKKILITRKTFPALRITAMQMMLELLEEMDLMQFWNLNKSTGIMRGLFGNMILFGSFDKPDKIKSTEWNYIYMEEANEFTWDDFIVLMTRLSGKVEKGERNQLVMSCNPSDLQSWVKTRLHTLPGVQFIYSTYNDNPFLDKAYIKRLEYLKKADPTYWKIYGKGEWATPEELIFKNNFHIVDSYGGITPDFRLYGLDFGFNHPMVLEELWFHDLKIYLHERVHESSLTNQLLIDRMNNIGIDKTIEMYGDSSRTDSIQDVDNAGFNIFPCKKGVGSVYEGIQYLKKFQIYSLNTNVRTNEDFQTYKWRVDKNGRILDEPVKWRDDAPDSVRYPVWTALKDLEGGDAIAVSDRTVYA